MDSPAHRLASLIADSERVVALTGAGISVPSGIPDFRSPGTGIWENVDPMGVAHIDVFLKEPVRFWQFYRPRFGMLAEAAPNPAHDVLAKWEQQGRLEAVVTQNIDVLHRRAGSKEVIEVHGTVEHGSCWECKAQYQTVQVEASFDSDGVPRCERCGGAIKPDVVLFGEMLPEAAIQRAYMLAASADLLIAIGTSLEVHPVASLPMQTLQAGGQLALVTMGATPYDSQAVVKLEGDVVDELLAVEAQLNT